MRQHEALIEQITATGGTVGVDAPPVPAAAPEPATRLLQVGLTRPGYQHLIDYQAGKRGRPTLDGVRRFVLTVAAAAAGKKMPPAISAYPITLVLDATMRAALRRLHEAGDYEFSDSAIACVFRLINAVAH